MMWFFAILIVLAMGGVAVMAAGKGAPLAPEHGDARDVTVPAQGPISAADLRNVRFTLSLRGYRMSEVDALLDRLARERETETPAAEPAADAPADDASGTP